MTKEEKKLMDDVHAEITKIMNRCKTKNEYLSVVGACLAYAQKSYVTYMGDDSTAMMFYSIADRLATKGKEFHNDEEEED